MKNPRLTPTAQKQSDKKNKKRRRLYPFLALIAVASLVILAASINGEAVTRPLRYYTDSNGTALTYFTQLNNDTNISAWGINTDNPLCELDINGSICINRTGFYFNGVNLTAGGASSSLSYVTMSAEGSLSGERVLTAGKGITVTDTGANGIARINITDLNTCTGTQASQYNGTGWACVTSGGDGNNRVLTGAFTVNGANYVLNLELNNTNNVSAFFTIVTDRGINITNGTIYINGTTCGAGEYSRYDGYGFSCHTDSTGSYTFDLSNGSTTSTVGNGGTLNIYPGNNIAINQTNTGITITSTSTAGGNVSSTNGTSGYLARFTNSTNIATGAAQDNGTAIGIGGAPTKGTLDVYGNVSVRLGGNQVARFHDGSNASGLYTIGVGITGTGGNGYVVSTGSATKSLVFGTGATIDLVTSTGNERMRINGTTGNIGINTTVTPNTLNVQGVSVFVGDTRVADDNSGNLTPRAQFDIVDAAGNAALAIIRNNGSYLTINPPGGTPFATRLATRTTTAQQWLDGTQTGTTFSVGDTAFGSNSLLPILFVDADRYSVGVNTNATFENFTVGGNVSFKNGSNYTYFYASDATGNVGINTSAPTATLHVVGVIKTNNMSVDQNLTVSGFLSTPGICLNGDCKTAWPAGGPGGSGMTEFGVSNGSVNSTMQNTSTMFLYAGTNIAINQTNTGFTLACTATSSGGSANASTNMSGSTIAMSSSYNESLLTNSILTQASSTVTANGNLTVYDTVQTAEVALNGTFNAFTNTSYASSNSTPTVLAVNNSMPFARLDYDTGTGGFYDLMPMWRPGVTMQMWQAGAGSSTTIPTPMGTAVAATANQGTIANAQERYTGPIWGSATTTTYLSPAGVKWNTNNFYLNGTTYCEGVLVLPSASYANQDIFVGLSNQPNSTGVIFSGTYTSQSAVGFILAQNATTGKGPAFHAYASSGTAASYDNTTINVTAGHIYKYSFRYLPDVNRVYYTFNAMNESRTYTGNISTNLPATTTAMAPGTGMVQRAATAATIRSPGMFCISWPLQR
jgi:hypothetical protein